MPASSQSPGVPLSPSGLSPATATSNACDLLDADHLAVKHLFVDYARIAFASDEQDEALRGPLLSLARKICDELTVHARIEEEIFYPALQEALPGMADMIDEARAEHQQAKELMAQIEDLDDADEAMDELVAELAWVMEHHVKEERDELFPKARAAKDMDLQALAEKLRERQQALKAAA